MQTLADLKQYLEETVLSGQNIAIEDLYEIKKSIFIKIGCLHPIRSIRIFNPTWLAFSSFERIKDQPLILLSIPFVRTNKDDIKAYQACVDYLSEIGIKYIAQDFSYENPNFDLLTLKLDDVFEYLL